MIIGVVSVHFSHGQVIFVEVLLAIITRAQYIFEIKAKTTKLLLLLMCRLLLFFILDKSLSNLLLLC